MRKAVLGLVVVSFVFLGLTVLTERVTVGGTTAAVSAAEEKGAAAPAGKAGELKTSSYVGTTNCKLCHNNPAKGAQYKSWAATAHATAFAALATPAALEAGKKAGVEGSPQQSAKCLECHVTGTGAAAELRAKVKAEDGVGCESCHGPGSGYAKMDVMRAVFAGQTPPASVGLQLPDEKTCRGCHNDRSPTFKEFDFAKMSAKIAHPYPAEFAKTRGRKS